MAVMYLVCLALTTQDKAPLTDLVNDSQETIQILLHQQNIAVYFFFQKVAMDFRVLLGEEESKLILDYAESGNIEEHKLEEIARKLGPRVVGRHKRRTNQGEGWKEYGQEMRQILDDWVNDQEGDMTKEKALTELIKIFRDRFVLLNPLARGLERKLTEHLALRTSNINQCSVPTKSTKHRAVSAEENRTEFCSNEQQISADLVQPSLSMDVLVGKMVPAITDPGREAGIQFGYSFTTYQLIKYFLGFDELLAENLGLSDSYLRWKQNKDVSVGATQEVGWTV